MKFVSCVVFLVLSVFLSLSFSAHGDEASGPARLTLSNVSAPPAISADEPLAKEFSLIQASRYLDRSSLHWQKERKCGTCHTNFAYLMARPALTPLSKQAPEVRPFFEDMVQVRWKEKGPRWDAEVVAAATTLAFNDRTTTGELHPATRTALERMATIQREDGGWDWLKCGWPPFESDDHFGVTFAALGIGVAPENYDESEIGRKTLDGIRKYLEANSPPTLHHRAMLLWSSLHVEDLMSKPEREETLADLFDLQLSDGGWAIAALIENWEEHSRKDDKPQDTKTSDGYGTGLIVFLARQAGVSREDPRIQRGVQWLKLNQRESGRWFTRSPTKDSRHFITNAGTAFAVMALAACGEVPAASIRRAEF